MSQEQNSHQPEAGEHVRPENHEKKSESPEKSSGKKVSAEAGAELTSGKPNEKLLDQKATEQNKRVLTQKEAEVLATRGGNAVGASTGQQGGRMELYESKSDGTQKIIVPGRSAEQVATLQKLESTAKAYTAAGLGNPDEPIGKPSQSTETAEQQNLAASPPNRVESPLKQNIEAQPINSPVQMDQSLVPLGTAARQPELISQMWPVSKTNPEAVERTKAQAIPIAVGEAKGVLNFLVNNLSSIGDGIRMAVAANREGSPLKLVTPDLDPEGTRKLHDACSGLSVGARILLQYDTTFNPASPLFGNEFDPEGSRMARQLAEKMPGKLQDEMMHYRNASPEVRAEKATELGLNILMFAETGGLAQGSKVGQLSKLETIARTGEELTALGKVGQAANETKLLTKTNNDIQSFVLHLKELPQSKQLQEIAKAFDDALPKFPQKELVPVTGPRLDRLSPVDRPGFSLNGLEDLYHPKVYIKDGKEMKIGQAAHEAGIPRDRFKEKTPEELAVLGIKVVEPAKYHVPGTAKPLTEAQMAKTLGISKQELREMTPVELGKNGVTEIEQVNGRYPINCEWAGKTYPFKDKQPELFKELCKEYPDLAKELEKGIRYTEAGYPDLKPFEQAEYKFNHPFADDDRAKDFLEADKAIWKDVKTADQGDKRRKELGLTWHHVERRPGEPPTMQLVPTKLHKNVPHTGGVATQESLKTRGK